MKKEIINMKRFLAVLLAALLAVTMLAACGDNANDDPQNGGNGNEVVGNGDETPDNGEADGEDDVQGDEDVVVMSYAEYAAAELETQVVVETYVQAKQSWWENSATLYTQDQDGAYFIYNVACSEEDYAKLTEGTKIRVTGYKAEWAGEIEIIDGTFEIIEGDTFVAEPKDVTSLLGTDELIDSQNQLVSFKGMTVEPSTDADGNEVAYLYSWDGSGTEGDDLYFNVSVNGNTYSFVVESYLCDSTTEVYSAVKNLQVGDKIDMEGFLYWYEGVNPHIISVTPAAE